MRKKRITIINNRKSCWHKSFIIFFLSTSKYVFRFLLSGLRKDGSVPQIETVSLDFYCLSNWDRNFSKRWDFCGGVVGLFCL